MRLCSISTWVFWSFPSTPKGQRWDSCFAGPSVNEDLLSDREQLADRLRDDL
jgi:hypothetical protein